jgi:hypothetical protein
VALTPLRGSSSRTNPDTFQLLDLRGDGRDGVEEDRQ